MRVLVFCGDPGVPVHGPSGASAHLRSVACALRNLGHSVAVAALYDHDERGRYAVGFDLPRYTLGREPWRRGLRGLGRRLHCRALARQARMRFGPVDLVWERASLHCDAGLRLARAEGAHHLLELNAPLDLDEGRAGQLSRTVRGTDQVLAVSPWLAAWAWEKGARRVRHVPNASRLVGVPGVPVSGRPNGLVMVHHGSNRPWHGTAFLAPLTDALPEAELWLMGPPIQVDHPRIRQLGFLEGPVLAGRLDAADVGLLPYPDDAPPWLDPLKVADYRARGLPTVGSLHVAARGASVQVGATDLAGWVDAVRERSRRRVTPCGPTWEEACASVLWAVKREG